MNDNNSSGSVNSSRSSINNNIGKLVLLGKSLHAKWDSKRRNRSI